MKENNDIEEIFKKAFENFEASPGANAWEAIKSNIGSSAAASGSAGAGATATSGISTWVATAVIAVVLSTAIVGGYFYFDTKSENIKTVKFEDKMIETEVEQATSPNKAETKENTGDENSEPSLNSPKSIVKNGPPIINEEKQENIETDNNSISTQKADNEDLTIVKDSETINESKTTVSTEDFGTNRKAIEPKETQSTKPTEDNFVGKENVSIAKTKNEAKSTKKPLTTNKSSLGNMAQKKDTVQTPIFDNPNVFSPNQDGVNDKWIVKVSDFDNIVVNVFNKTNELVYQYKGIRLNDFWDGRLSNGSNAPEGVYFYQIIVEKEGRYYKDMGVVTLKR